MPEQSLVLFRMAHLIVLCLWGGLVITESVIELLPFKRKELQDASIVYHFWIDLLVEAPLVAAVIVTGLLLAFNVQLTALHFVKIALAAFTASMNVVCIFLVVRRHAQLNRGADEESLWKYTRGIMMTFGFGIAAGGGAAALGFYLAMQTMGMP